jgi:two-component system response regulator HydG
MGAGMTLRILIVDDDADQCALLESVLARLGYGADATTSARDALELVTRTHYGAILTDLEMHEMSGLDLCHQLVAAAPGVPVVVVTGDSSVETAIAAIRTGAFDYITKPVDAKLLGLSVARATHRSRLLTELSRLRERTEDKTTLLGESPAMRRVLEMIARVASSDASVLIHGETGTGKELVARAIHKASARAHGPFVAINCAAVPASLLESELFGHAKGAFTDAKSQRDGLFLKASGGTLFLDEIGDMAPEMQSKLLRALQERCVRPVGSNVEVPFDARVFSATHRDLDVEVRERRFREDLYYRINVVCIDVPPLRERSGDTLRLAAHFLARFCDRAERTRVGLSPQVAERLLAYDWPGNVRELENCMERVAALARYELAVPEDLPENLRVTRDDRFTVTAESSEGILKIDELERRHIFHVLKLVDGNKSRAAQLLGLDRRTLYRKLDLYRATRSASEREQEQEQEQEQEPGPNRASRPSAPVDAAVA